MSDCYSLRWFCEDRREISAAEQSALQEMLDRYPPRFAPDIRDVLRWRLREHFRRVAESGDVRSAARAEQCLTRFDDTPVETLQRCALSLL